jgi:hypothetical protein
LQLRIIRLCEREAVNAFAAAAMLAMGVQVWPYRVRMKTPKAIQN